MDTLLQNGDHARDGRRIPRSIDGVEELIQQALIRLSVPQGSFALAPRLGSQLHRLHRSPSRQTQRLALAWAQEALSPMPGIAVRNVECHQPQPDTLELAIEISINSYNVQLEVAL